MYLEGTLDGVEAGAMAGHVGACPRCRVLLGELREATARMREAGASEGPPCDCPDWEMVAAYADGLLGPAEAAEAERHIAGCDDCLAFLSDLWSPPDAGAASASRELEARVLLALAREARTAVIRWERGAATLVKGFSRALEGMTPRRGEPNPELAFARGPATLRVGWSGPGGLALECGIGQASGRPTLVGRITTDGKAARAVSAMLRSGGSALGPESADAEGRFGPWPLADGLNELVLTGAGLPDGRIELVVDVVGSG